MALDIVRGTNNKPAASTALVNALRDGTRDLTGQLFLGFPIIRTATGPRAVDALWFSEQKGIVVFDLVEAEDIENYRGRQDDAFNAIDGHLRIDRRLVDRRNLRIPVNVLTFAPRCADIGEEDYPILTRTNVADHLAALDDWSGSCPEASKAALSTLQNVSTIRRPIRSREQGARRAAKLKKLEDAITTLDPWQSQAMIETIEGVQRIRGLAGSGKTIVLALKAAYLHALHPEWRIAITFHTRSLKDAFERWVRDFLIRYTDQEPDWSHLEVVNAWGARGGDGIYRQFCRTNNVDYLDFGAASLRSPADPFAGACQAALNEATRAKTVYDAVLVDEAQDLPPDFLRLCYAFLNKPKRLVYAYDELQRLSGESMPSPEEIFGAKANGKPRISLDSRQDIILRTCYRNSRPILVTAHALGFGIYRRPSHHPRRQTHRSAEPPRRALGLVQMFDQDSLWQDVGYSIIEGKLEEGQEVTLHRDQSASPIFLEEHSSYDDLIQFRVFDDEDEQARWIVDAVEQNLSRDGLRPDDIIVINPNPRTTRSKAGTVRARMLERGVACHLVGVDANRDTFFIKGSIALSHVPRAKGNEAAMVYVINAESGVADAHNAATGRNRLFAAITRSKAWVRVSGVGPAMAELKREYERLVENDFKLRFQYPTAAERKEIRTIHRDLSPQQRKKRDRTNSSLRGLIQDILRGGSTVEDIEPEIRDQLLTILGEGSESANRPRAD